MSSTLAIIKPDAVGSGLAGKILAHLEDAGFTVCAIKMTRLDPDQAGVFYEVHKERPFYDSLVGFMTSGPVIPMVSPSRRCRREAAADHRRNGSG